MAERLFNVVIEQPRAQGPAAVAALATAIAARYGIPAADLERRIARGRFRVKSKVDRATADTYAADLTRLGAIVVVLPVEESTTQSMPAVSGPIDIAGLGGQAAPAAQAPRPAPAQKWPSEPPRTEISPPPPASIGERAAQAAQARWLEEAPRTEVTAPPARTPEPASDRRARETPRPRTAEPAGLPDDVLHPVTDTAWPRVTKESLRPAGEPRPAPVAEAPRAPERPRPLTEPPRPLPLAPPPASAPVPARTQAPSPTVAAPPPPTPAAPAPPPPAPPHPSPTSGPFAPSPSAISPPPAPPSAAPAPAAPLDLGALSANLPLTLSTLDGAAPETAAAGSALPASFGPPAAREPTPIPAPIGASLAGAASAPPSDLFAPPAAAALEVALDTAAPTRRELAARAPARPPDVPWPATTLPPRVSETRPAITGVPAIETGARPRGGLNPYARVVAGAVLAVGLGFIPAHLVGAMREKTAYGELDRDLTRREAAIKSRAEYDAFEAVRSTYAERKRAARTNIALTSMALWALAGGGFAWLWFRRIAPPAI